MASLFRPSYTKIDPATGNRVTRKVRKWYGKYRDATGRLCCKPLSPVKTAAMAMLTDLVRRVEFQKAGLIDECAEHLKQPIAAALAEFRRHLESTLRSPTHVPESARIVGKIVAACQLTTLAEQDVKLISHRENIDLGTAQGRMLAGLFGVLAEYELAIIKERTMAGMRAAKAKGKQIGNRKRFLDIEEATRLRDRNVGQQKIAKLLGVGVGRVNAWCRDEYLSPEKRQLLTHAIASTT